MGSGGNADLLYWAHYSVVVPRQDCRNPAPSSDPEKNFAEKTWVIALEERKEMDKRKDSEHLLLYPDNKVRDFQTRLGASEEFLQTVLDPLSNFRDQVKIHRKSAKCTIFHLEKIIELLQSARTEFVHCSTAIDKEFLSGS